MCAGFSYIAAIQLHDPSKSSPGPPQGSRKTAPGLPRRVLDSCQVAWRAVQGRPGQPSSPQVGSSWLHVGPTWLVEAIFGPTEPPGPTQGAPRDSRTLPAGLSGLDFACILGHDFLQLWARNTSVNLQKPRLQGDLPSELFTARRPVRSTLNWHLGRLLL